MPAATPNATTPARGKYQRGSTVILFTMLCSLLLIPVAALAIDASIVYLMKAKLSAAVDAAALATARGLNVGTNLASQIATATITGDNYFAANLPAGTMGATVVGGVPTITVVSVNNNTLQATVTATITVPLTLMRILRFQSATLSATGQASRRVSNIILILDRSYSVSLGANCGNLISSAESFVNDFVDGTDTMGLVDFQASANEDFKAATNFKSSSQNINFYINQLQCSGYTNTTEALAAAYARLQAINQPLANNVIVLFTDGNADTIYATFPLRSLATADTIYNWKPVNQSNPGTGQVGASSCAASLTGIVTNLPGGLTPANDTGGVYQDTFYSGTPQLISWVSPYEYSNPYYPYPAAAMSGSGCNFTSTSYYSYPTNTLAVRNDVAYLPATDATPYKNSLQNSYYTVTSGSLTSAPPTDILPSTSPYSGKLRIDTVQSVNNAALSSADNMANTIRSGTAIVGPSIKATIYTIGLGNPPYEIINTTFLQRVANDLNAPGHNSSQPTGLFIASTSSGLQAAFQQIASQILRLSK